MTISKSKAKVTTRTPARKASKAASSRRGTTSVSPARSAVALSKPITTNPRTDTKHARILAMLRSSAGATVAAIMTATEWQQHSVRGFLAGVVRKKLGLILVSEQTDKGRVYRIRDAENAAVSADRIKHAA